MDYYETGNDPSSFMDNFRDLAEQYKKGRWEIGGGASTANIYATNPRQCGFWSDAVDHGTGANFIPQDEQARPSRGTYGGPRTGLDDMVEAAASELVRAIRADVFPPESSECIFGIEMKATNRAMSVSEFPLGTLIYNVWCQIYKRRLFYAGETNFDAPGPASNEFARELAAAIKNWTIPEKFEEWTNEVVYDEEFALKAHSIEMKKRGFATKTGLINRHSEGHRNMRNLFIALRDSIF